MTFIEKNLDGHLKRLLELVRDKSPQSLSYLFRENFNILLLALKRSNLSMIEYVFSFYLSNTIKHSSKKSLVNRRKINIFHRVIQNQTLSLVYFLLILAR
jgi:hypothetical protein